MREINIAVIICTYHRKECVTRNVEYLESSFFFEETKLDYYGHLEVFVIDNASELNIHDKKFVHYVKNRNTGGAGGFQRGVEEVRKRSEAVNFTHVLFMDDDVRFELSSLYILYDFLRNVDENQINRPVVGRMLDIDHPNIQWTAAEKWNGGNISHVEFLRNTQEKPFVLGKVNYGADAEYGGFWFACYPYSYVKNNDILPFFIHCDDVEYGLRCGKKPIIIEGVHVWHETFEKRITPQIRYYDMRNPLFVNQIYGFLKPKDEMLQLWKEQITEFHIKGDLISEYMLIIGLRDFLRGLKWLKRIDSEKYHKKLMNIKTNRWKNALSWRFVEIIFRYRYKESKQ